MTNSEAQSGKPITSPNCAGYLRKWNLTTKNCCCTWLKKSPEASPLKAELKLTAQSLQVKSLRPLFQMNLADTPAPLFDVTADGQRFLAVTPARAEASSISLLLNWPALLHK